MIDTKDVYVKIYMPVNIYIYIYIYNIKSDLWSEPINGQGHRRRVPISETDMNVTI